MSEAQQSPPMSEVNAPSGDVNVTAGASPDEGEVQGGKMSNLTTPDLDPAHDPADDGDLEPQDQEVKDYVAPEAIFHDTTTDITATPASKIRADSKRIMTTPADDSGLVQPMLPVIPRGQVKESFVSPCVLNPAIVASYINKTEQMGSLLSRARRRGQEDNPPTMLPHRARVPPKLVRLATVTVSPAKSRSLARGPSLYYEEPRRPQKVITWEEASQARPPLRIDMEGPGPCTYSPLNKPLMETNAPSFTFGTKCQPERSGGSRTSWGKSWFQSDHLYHMKADYVREGLWPSPNHYPKPSLLGPRQRTLPEAPSFTFGHKQAFSMGKAESQDGGVAGSHKEPSPNDYERQNADKLVLRRGPSFTHQMRRQGTVLWGSTETNPGPAAYTPIVSSKAQNPRFTIQGIRREKSHVLGPYHSM